MSTASTAARPSGWPYRRIVLAVLAVSVVLNLLFIAGAVWTRMQASPARGLDQRLERIGAELALDPQQQIALDQYLVALRARSDKVQQEVAPLYAAAWEEAGKPTADAARVLRLFDEAFDKRRELNRETVTETLDFLATLSPEQRSKFVALARERRGLWRSPRGHDR